MGLIGGTAAALILKAFVADRVLAGGEDHDPTEPSLTTCFGDDFFRRIDGKTVVDFGSGRGRQAVEMCLHSTARVRGLEIQERLVRAATARAAAAGVQDRCTFSMSCNVLADVITSKDAFEHFSDPAAVLRQMATMLAPKGVVLVSFGPTWYHPRGGHLFSVFPWAHLIFTESALIRWRSQFRDDGATRFAEVEGGLNQMTIAGFEQIVAQSPFSVESMELVPIRGLSILRRMPFREFGTSLVRCRLSLRKQN